MANLLELKFIIIGINFFVLKNLLCFHSKYLNLFHYFPHYRYTLIRKTDNSILLQFIYNLLMVIRHLLFYIVKTFF